MQLPVAFVEDKPRKGEHGFRYEVFNLLGDTVASGRGETEKQAREVAVRLMRLLCDVDAIPF